MATSVCGGAPPVADKLLYFGSCLRGWHSVRGGGAPQYRGGVRTEGQLMKLGFWMGKAACPLQLVMLVLVLVLMRPSIMLVTINEQACLSILVASSWHGRNLRQDRPTSFACVIQVACLAPACWPGLSLLDPQRFNFVANF